MISLIDGLVLCTILFVVGLVGLIFRRNLLFMLIALEIMINSSALVFVVVGAYWHQVDGAIMYILIISAAAAEVSVGLALLQKFHYFSRNLDIDSLNELRE